MPTGFGNLIKTAGVLLVYSIYVQLAISSIYGNAPLCEAAIAQSSLPPISGGLNYGPCYYPGDNTIATRITPGTNIRVNFPANIKEFCPDAIANGVSKECREYWIRQASQIPFDKAVGTNNIHCPQSMYAAILVDHTDGSTSNHDIDGVNCGSLQAKSSGNIKPGPMASDTVESEVLTAMLNKFPEQIDDRRFWNKFTMYSVIEPGVAPVGQMISVGIREIVYSVRVGSLIAVGYPINSVKAVDILQRQRASYVGKPNPQVITNTIMRDVLHQDMFKLAAWPFNATQPCPGQCQPFREGTSRGARCRTS